MNEDVAYARNTESGCEWGYINTEKVLYCLNSLYKEELSHGRKSSIHRTEKDGGCTFYLNTLRA